MKQTEPKGESPRKENIVLEEPWLQRERGIPWENPMALDDHITL